MIDQDFDRVLARLERDAMPERAYADRLFSQLVPDAGFGRRRWSDDALPRWGRLAWLAAALLALLALMSAVLLSGGAPRPPILAITEPSPTAAETSTASPSEEIRQLRPSSDVLEVGAVAPSWSGQLLNGEPFSTEDLRGRPAALLVWCSCVSGPEARIFLDEAARRVGSVDMVLVAMDSEGTTRALVDSVAGGTPVVLDTESKFVVDWDLSFFPAMVLLRADGTVADLQPMTFDAESLAAIVDSLAAGGAVPEPTPFPSPPVDEDGRQPLSTVLKVGQEAPELDGPRLGGGTISTGDLRGRPTAVLFWTPPRLDGTPEDDTPAPDSFLDAVAERGAALNVLLVARGEPEPGAAAAYLERQGADVPVILDPDGALHDRWGLVMFTTLVLLDSDGTVAGYLDGSALSDPAPLLDTLIAGDPLPSPKPIGP